MSIKVKSKDFGIRQVLFGVPACHKLCDSGHVPKDPDMSPHLGKGDSKTYYRKIVSSNNDISVIPHTSFMISSKVLIISEPQALQI